MSERVEKHRVKKRKLQEVRNLTKQHVMAELTTKVKESKQTTNELHINNTELYCDENTSDPDINNEELYCDENTSDSDNNENCHNNLDIEQDEIDKCLTQKKSEVDEIFLQECGKKPEEMLHEVESEPVAAASLAQVYKAVTLDGDKVAIKVQYMNLQDRFISDLKGIVYLLKAITYVHPKFDLHWIFAEIIDRLRLELDFEIEGRNSEQCAKDLKKFKYAYVPKVYWNLSTKRILVTEWIDG
ncbi:uncharacterized aarF domain-containing protein kinase 5-like [Ooceraea biroi]|uniref:uncharacterized aarF domain-containing protein kinase 5-like n=1 Tax=Ooceraea biroi TaxID=2015173 RepID=UPI000F09095D|nr:uncharacterized aarF domain-containing protein kinase 5-like [Ooceraea biroi]